MAEFTDITVLLDRSGSMESIKTAMESAFNEFVQQHRAVPSSRLTLVQFDTENPQEVVYTDKPIADVPHLDMTPRGGTPLCDALVRAIDSTGSRLKAMAEADRPDQVLFVVITDGQENASREFNRKAVFDRVTKQTNTYKWQFVYLGANQDAIAEAATFGIGAQNSLSYAAMSAGVASASGSLASNTVAYTSRTSKHVRGFSGAQRAGAMTGKKPTKP